jgi:hypothetical protein
MKHTARPPHRLAPLPACIGAAVVTAAVLLTRAAVGSPWELLHRLSAASILPPLWLLSLLWMVSFALVGGAAGGLLAAPEGNAHRRAHLWQGSTFLVLAVVFALAWYTLLFGKLWVLISCLFPLLAAASALLCALSWRLAGGGAWMAPLGYALWQILVLLLQLAVLLHL